MTMPVQESTAVLRALLSEVDADPDAFSPRDGPRVFVGGSPHDHPAVYEIIESCGATVVGEDHCWGNRTAFWDHRTDLSPLQRLAWRFHEQPACSIQFPMSDTVDLCVRRAALAQPDAAIFFGLEHETAQVWETPDEIRGLAEHGIPSLHLSEQPYRLTDREGLRARIEAFLGPIRTARTGASA
jgi:benzoyl-CoA reductase/2-hydroxyglutaryl-CoA dehydratase subunit BcrC/BadD/HgdB